MSAVEIEAASSLRRWLQQRRGVLENIAVQGTWLEHEDVEKLLKLSLPGIDELAALLEISRLARGRRFDLIVVDTAPTGHTLRMLAMPATLADLAAVFDRMREKQRVMEEALRGAWRHGPEDALIVEIATIARDLAALLRDPARTRVSWVTLPEPMAIAESTDALTALQQADIRVDAIIVNRMTPAPPVRCGHCDARRAFESHALRSLPGAGTLTGVAARDVEPRGIRALLGIARELGAGPLHLAKTGPARRWQPSLAGSKMGPADLVPPAARLVMFGGKGGVGKTTCAAALALSVARRSPSRQVLLISADPAHSLADVLGAAVGDTPRPVAGAPNNLSVREIDPSAILTRIRQRYVAAVDGMFNRLSGGSFDVAHDRSVMRSLIHLAPPGLDELGAILETTEAISGETPSWDLVIMDTAPTGHALRLLEMPALIQGWTRALMGILLKYHGVVQLGELGEMLLDLSKGIGGLRALLSDRDRCLFIAVTRAAALPRLETLRLVRRLASLQVHSPAMVINAVGRGTCSRCRESAAVERREIGAIAKALPSAAQMVVASAQIPPPHGPAALRRWADTSWHSAAGYHQGR